MSAYQEWLDGTLEPSRALHALCSDLGETEDEYQRIGSERDALRAQISEIVSVLGNKATVPGFGELRITGASKTVSYDRKLISELEGWLLDHGETGYAQKLRACRKESMRAGSLHIVREKQL
jgi:hypothetical protein